MAAIVLTVAIIALPILLLIISIYKSFKRLNAERSYLGSIQLQSVNADEILDDVNRLISKECEKFKNTNLAYRLAKHSTMMDMSVIGSSLTVITDEVLESEADRISRTIIERMSDVYRDKILLVIAEDHIDSYIYEETYAQLLVISIDINTNV